MQYRIIGLRPSGAFGLILMILCFMILLFRPCYNDGMTSANSDPQFICDAMLGGLARWLRAAGYDALWRADIDDWDAIRLAQGAGRILLTSDTGIFRVGIVRDGDVRALHIPHGLNKQGQLAFVLRQLDLPLREPRCMACGGSLKEAPREQVRDRVPARTLSWVEKYYACTRCGQVFWEGTHWQKIAQVLKTSEVSKTSEV